VWLDSLASGAIMQGASRELVDLAEQAARHACVAPDFSAPPVCPTCQRGLVRAEVPGTATEIHTCSVHGTWFDSNVLPMVALAFERPPANIVTAAAAVGQAIVTEDHAAATRMSRFIAAGIDGSLEVMVGLALLVLVKLLAGVLPVSLTLLALPVLGVLLFQCFQWVLLAQDGQTIGKRLEGIRIVRNNGAPAGFLSAVFLRSMAMPLAAFVAQGAASATDDGPLGLALSSVAQLFDLALTVDVLLILLPPRRALHDYLAGTRVIEVYVRPERKQLGRLVFIVGVTFSVLGLLFVVMSGFAALAGALGR
jgi:uncharacterized RDD family membrane protein YckC